MKKNLILMFGILLVLVACGYEDEGNEQAGVLVDDGSANDSGEHYETGDEREILDEPLIIGERTCRIISVEGTNTMNMYDFFDRQSEIMDEYLGDFDAFFSARIDNYAGLFYAASEGYIILLAEDVENWDVPNLLAGVNFTICQADHSYEELSAVRTQIDENYQETSARITSWGIDTMDNIVVVYIADLTDEAILDFKENVSDSPLIDFREEGSVIFNATIIEMHEEPIIDWYDDEMTVLVTSEEFGRMIFDHRRLEDIGATVGDIVEITITGGWVQPDPQPVYPDSWRLVD